MTNAPAPKRRVSHDGNSGVEDSESTLVPPDGGWGWMVVFASFMIHIVTDGVTYSFGVLYVEFLNYFEEGKGATAWIASILVGMTLCSGPISSSFVNKYGCRMVTIAGAILGFVCLVCSIFATNVLTLYFTIGIGTGLGFGLIYLPAIVSVSCYFEKYRSLATGIAVCGSGLGTFIFAPLTEFFVDEYGWRGAILLIAALVLQCTTFGALFRPVEQYQKRRKPSPANEPKYLTTSLLEKNGSNEGEEGAGGGSVDPSGLVAAPGRTQNGNNQIQRPVSVGNFSMSKTNYLHPLEKRDNDNNEMSRLARSQPVLANLPTTSHTGESSKPTFGSHTGLIDRKDIFYHGSLHSLHQLQIRRSNMKLSMEKPGEKGGNFDGRKKKGSKLCGCLPCPVKMPDTLTEMFDFSLLKDPIFILFTISNFFTSIGFNIPYVYIVAQAQERGITKENASYLLAVIGIANTIGRVILGYISDKPWVNRLLIYNTSLAICGIATALSALCYNFYSFAVYGTVYGFTIGAYVGLTSVILVDLMGLDHLTNAFGLLLLFQGIASLIGPPIAGWLYDAFETYDPGFVVAGVVIAISGIMLFVINPVKRYLEKREQSKRGLTMIT